MGSTESSTSKIEGSTANTTVGNTGGNTGNNRSNLFETNQEMMFELVRDPSDRGFALDIC